MFDQNKVYSLVFSLVVLVSVLIGNARRGSSDEVVYTDRPEQTSIVASAQVRQLAEIAPVVGKPAGEASLPETPPAITASSAAVLYIDNNETLFSNNPNQQWPVASLTKLMTAVIAAETINEHGSIRVSQRAVDTEGAAGNLVAGKIYSRDELLHALLKVSSNDAAEALAEYGGREEFIEMMNQKAVSLGMYNTRYFDPSGLSALNQSMASDLEKLVIYIFNHHPDIFAITREREGNIHPFAKQENFIGGKTGFIDEASGNLISLFRYQNRPLLIIVLGSDDRAKDTKLLYDRFTGR